MGKTKERLQDLRKERKWTYEALATKLYDRDEHIDRNTLWAFEVDEPDHPKYQRTRKMRVEQLVALAEVFDVSVEYLLGISDHRKREYQGIGKELNLTPAVVDQLKSFQDMPPDSEINILSVINRLLINPDFIQAMKYLVDAAFAQKHGLKHQADLRIGRGVRGDESEKATEKLREYGMEAIDDATLSELYSRWALDMLSRAVWALPKTIVEGE